jgi:hypothetical protein
MYDHIAAHKAKIAALNTADLIAYHSSTAQAAVNTALDAAVRNSAADNLNHVAAELANRLNA